MTLTTLRRRAGASAAVAALAATALALPAQAVPVEDSVYADRTVMSTGHLDLLYVHVVDGQKSLLAHTELGDLEASELVLHAKPSVAARTVSAMVATLPGMKAQGETYYLLPQSSQPGQLFVGFGYSSALPTGTSVTHAITDFEGPGELVVWQNTEDGPLPFVGSADDAPSSFTSSASHEHVNWGFTDLGEYTITVTSSVTVPGGIAETLAPATYTVYVGEDLPAADNGGPGEPGDPSGPGDTETVLTVTGLAHHYHAGGIASLTAVQEPDTGESHYHWFTREGDAGEWEVVPGASSETYSFVVRTADDGLQVKAVLYGQDHGVIAESEPVTIDVDDHGNDPVNGPTITATLPANEGSLTVSVAPENREVDLGDLTLAPEADRHVADGSLKPIT
ncbi:choice-of-anchor M domain-containing protein, partial [Cellulomonas bogoriensis]|uniref:choice-of-anchor M domain-containing protein n=1 Tax=Cellulomonas bogoriensis TaxID=301388 RepID=UPI0012EC8214